MVARKSVFYHSLLLPSRPCSAFLLIEFRASRDKRPMGPPTFILMNLYQVHHPVCYTRDGRPIEPPPNCSETQIPATDNLSAFFICIPWLFRVYPPTREEELGRVLRTKGACGQERIRAQKGDQPKAVNTARSTRFSAEPECDDGDSGGSLEEADPEDPRNLISRDYPYSSLPSPAIPYPYPATAISCNDPRWPVAVAIARNRAREQWRSVPDQPCPINHGSLTVGVDVSREEMAYIQEYLPREDLRFVRTECGFEDMRSRLQEVSTRKGCLSLNTFSTGSKGYMFVFDVSVFLPFSPYSQCYSFIWVEYASAGGGLVCVSPHRPRILFPHVLQLGHPLCRLQHRLDAAPRLLFWRTLIWDSC